MSDQICYACGSTKVKWIPWWVWNKNNKYGMWGCKKHYPPTKSVTYPSWLN